MDNIDKDCSLKQNGIAKILVCLAKSFTSPKATRCVCEDFENREKEARKGMYTFSSVIRWTTQELSQEIVHKLVHISYTKSTLSWLNLCSKNVGMRDVHNFSKLSHCANFIDGKILESCYLLMNFTMQSIHTGVLDIMSTKTLAGCMSSKWSRSPM